MSRSALPAEARRPADDVTAALDPVAFAGRLRLDAEPWEARLLQSTARRQLVACSRQVGKTTTAAYKAGALVLIASSTQRQSDKMLRRIRGVYRAAGRPHRERRRQFIDLGARERQPHRQPARHREHHPVRRGGRAAFIDEAARVDDDVFAGVRPKVASTGTFACLSTPWASAAFLRPVGPTPTGGNGTG